MDSIMSDGNLNHCVTVKIIKYRFICKLLKIDYDTNKYIKKIAKSDTYFHTFINKENLAAGVLRLDPGEDDTQKSHESDEIYYVVKGDGFLSVDKKDYPISEGMAYYVAKKIPHRFHGNKKELVVMYFFGGPDT